MPRLGVLSNLYLNVGGTAAQPAWLVLDLVSDLVVNSPWDEGEASTRQTRVKLMEPTMMGLDITGKVRVHYANLNNAYLKMYDNYYRDLPIDVLVLNGTLIENEAEGFRFVGKTFNWSEDQSLGTVLYKDFSIKPCIYDSAYGDQPPRKVKVNAGMLIYHNIGRG